MPFENLMRHFGLEHSVLARRMATGKGKQQPMKTTFFEFAVGLWNFCSAEEGCLSELLFRLLLPPEAEERELDGSVLASTLLRVLFGDSSANYHTAKLSAAKKSLALLEGVTVDLPLFRTLLESHGLLEPLLEEQRRLRTKLLGQTAWRLASARRRRLEEAHVKSNFSSLSPEVSRLVDFPVSPDLVKLTSAQLHSRAAGRDEPLDNPPHSTGHEEKEATSPGDHPSLRKPRRKSGDESNAKLSGRKARLEMDKHRELSAHELQRLRRDVLPSTATRDSLQRRNEANNKRARRRHSFGQQPLAVRIAPLISPPVGGAAEAGSSGRRGRRLTL